MKRVVVAVGYAVGALAIADLDYLAKGYNPYSRGEVESLVKSTVGPNASRAEKIRAQIEAISDDITKNKEVKRLRKELLDLQRENEVLSLAGAVPNKKFKDEVEQRLADNQAIAKQVSSLSRQSAAPADLSSNLIEQECRSGIDLSAGKLSADEVSKFNYFKKEVGKFVDRDDEKLEKAADEAAAKAEESLLKVLSGGDKKYSDNKDAQVAYLSDEAQIASLKKAVKKEEDKGKWWIKSIVKSIGEVRKKLAKLNKSDRQMAELSGFAADDLLAKVNRVKTEQVNSATQLQDKCRKEADLLGRDNPLAQNTLLNSAFETMRLWNASYATGGFMTMISSLSSRLSCPDVTADVQANWTPVESAVEAIRGATDPRTLVTSMVAVGDAVVAAQSQMGTKLTPLIDKLNFACRNRKKVENFVAALSAQTQQGQGSQTGSQASSSSSTASSKGQSRSSSVPAHNALVRK